MNSPIFKCSIYVLISAITAMATEIGKYHEFSEITNLKWSLIGINILLQSLIAVKAFTDQSLSEKSTSTPKEDNIESIN